MNFTYITNENFIKQIIKSCCQLGTFTLVIIPLLTTIHKLFVRQGTPLIQPTVT